LHVACIGAAPDDTVSLLSTGGRGPRILEVSLALIFCGLLSASALFGLALRGWLPEAHLSDQNMEAIRLVTSLLVTFVAVMLSLQLSSVKASFDKAYHDRNVDAANLAQIDQCLRNYGPETAKARGWLQAYTAGVIASTWPDEPRPVGVDIPDTSGMARRGENATLGSMINGVGLAIDALAPADTKRQNLLSRCRQLYDAFQTSRWTVIEDVQGPASPLFSNIVTFWLMLVFVSFGLQMPRKRMSALVITIGVVSISSVMLVILDLERPYGGLFGITSTAMRDALADMVRADPPAP